MRLNGVQEVVGSNPASPSLGFLVGLLLSEDVPAGWGLAGFGSSLRNRYGVGILFSGYKKTAAIWTDILLSYNRIDGLDNSFRLPIPL